MLFLYPRLAPFNLFASPSAHKSSNAVDHNDNLLSQSQSWNSLHASFKWRLLFVSCAQQRNIKQTKTTTTTPTTTKIIIIIAAINCIKKGETTKESVAIFEICAEGRQKPTNCVRCWQWQRQRHNDVEMNRTNYAWRMGGGMDFGYCVSVHKWNIVKQRMWLSAPRTWFLNDFFYSRLVNYYWTRLLWSHVLQLQIREMIRPRPSGCQKSFFF